MKQIICPICKKDLTEALSLLNCDFRDHMRVHITTDEIKIWCYLNTRKKELPKDLQILIDRRKENIDALYKYEAELKNNA